MPAASKPFAKLFDRQKIARNVTRAANLQFATKGKKTKADFITDMILQDLALRLTPISRKFSNALILAPDITHLPKNLGSGEDKIEFTRYPTLFNDTNIRILDPEDLQLTKNKYDLIVSLFDIGFTDNVPKFLTHIHRALLPDGLFLAALIGGLSLTELRLAWLEADAEHLGGAVARIAPFIDIKDAGALLQSAGFALPVSDKETLKLRYASPLHLMKEIKSLGASNPLVSSKRALMGKAHLNSAIKSYENAASDQDKRIRATLEIIWLSGWSPHESQQKPMQPGSAQFSLAKILKDKT